MAHLFEGLVGRLLAFINFRQRPQASQRCSQLVFLDSYGNVLRQMEQGGVEVVGQLCTCNAEVPLPHAHQQETYAASEKRKSLRVLDKVT
jgi:hypothetical protein